MVITNISYYSFNTLLISNFRCMVICFLRLKPQWLFLTLLYLHSKWSFPLLLTSIRGDEHFGLTFPKLTRESFFIVLTIFHSNSSTWLVIVYWLGSRYKCQLVQVAGWKFLWMHNCQGIKFSLGSVSWYQLIWLISISKHFFAVLLQATRSKSLLNRVLSFPHASYGFIYF